MCNVYHWQNLQFGFLKGGAPCLMRATMPITSIGHTSSRMRIACKRGKMQFELFETIINKYIKVINSLVEISRAL